MYSTMFDELFSLNREINRLFNEPTFFESRSWPQTNIYDNSDEYVLVSKVPGLNKDDLEISIKDNTLTIKGQRAPEKPKDAKVHLQERSSGSFERNYLLNEKIDADKVKAETSNGLLIIKLPKSAESKPKKILIS